MHQQAPSLAHALGRAGGAVDSCTGRPRRASRAWKRSLEGRRSRRARRPAARAHQGRHDAQQGLARVDAGQQLAQAGGRRRQPSAGRGAMFRPTPTTA
jgi:hypothetical protein